MGLGVRRPLAASIDVEAGFNYHRTITVRPDQEFGGLQAGLVWHVGGMRRR